MLLDNGALHKEKNIIIPKKIRLLFLPSYSPELNPAELVWLHMKRKTTNVVYKTMEELKTKIDKIVNELITPEFIKSLCALRYYFNQH